MFYIENLIMDHPQPEDKHEYLERPPALRAVACTYTIHPLGFEGRNVFTKGSLLSNSGQHMQNMTVKHLYSQMRVVFLYRNVVERTAAQINPSRY